MTKIITTEEEKNNQYSTNAINLLRNSNTGILSTISKKNKDYPFGSFTTFISSRDRTICFYLSDIAQHTINFKANSKACLTISGNKTNDDAQNSERLSLMGDIKLLESNDINYYKNKFHTLFPASKKYADFHGFNFYQLEINSARWIGGFGKIAWLDMKNWVKKIPEWKGAENSIINHMNNDHLNSIISSLNAQHAVKDNTARMIFITIDGYYLQSSKGIFFIQTEKICYNMKEYKKELTKLAIQNRSFEL